MNWLEVIPAYGRDYKNQKEVQFDWDGGKDFQDPFSGSFVNKQDAEQNGLKVIIRYAKQMKVYSPK